MSCNPDCGSGYEVYKPRSMNINRGLAMMSLVMRGKAVRLRSG